MESPNQPDVAAPGPLAPPEISVGAEIPDGAPEPVAAPNPEAATPATSAAAPVRPVVNTFSNDVIGSVQSLLGTIVIAIFVITFVVQAFQIPSQSMENTLLVGDYLLVNKLCYGGAGLGDHLMPYQKIARGDVIVFHYPVDPAQHFVKRVIGVPGDRLRLISKKVWINGKPLDEPYVRFLEPPNGRDPNSIYRDNFPRPDLYVMNMEGKWLLQMKRLMEDGQLIIPEGNYFVMGDNRDDSEDSRYWGFVPRENIIGRPLLIYWSMRSVDNDVLSTSTAGDKLYHFVYAVSHIFQIT